RYIHRSHLDPHSFPTRRSSDLGSVRPSQELASGLSTLSYVEYGDVATSLVDTAYKHGWVQKNFDWRQWAQSKEAIELRDDPAERSEEHTSELQSRENLVCRLLL